MSYDLEIVTSDAPQRRHLEAFFAPESAVTMEGELGGEGVNLLVLRRGRPAFTIDGPVKVLPEDLDEEVASATLDPRWQVSISVPASAARETAAAKRLAKDLARECRGVAWDPQEERILWPPKSQGRFKPSTAKERIAVVELDWFLPGAPARKETARTLTGALSRVCPESVPVRFGSFEPLQSRWEPEGAEGFASAWMEAVDRDDAGIEFGGSLFWSGRPPCFGGHASFADLRTNLPAHYRRAGTASATRISTTFDGRALDGDSRWRELVVSLFVAVAEDLGAFYGAACVETGWMVSRGKIWADGDTANTPLQQSQWWNGIPPVPTWLAWFGGPYKSAIGSPPGLAVRPSGSLLRVGEAPLPAARLRSAFPRLPPRLLAKGFRDPVRPADEIPTL